LNPTETKILLHNFIILIKNEFNRNIKTIITDNGKEFDCNELYEKYGILHQRTCFEIPQQNVVAGRKHQHIMNTTRSLLFQLGLSKIYWSYAASHIIHLINRLPLNVLKGKSPYEMLYYQPPTYINHKTFGCLFFASTLENNRSKLEPRSRKSVFIGYKTDRK